ncbi:MAG: ribokinase [Oscillospiraceae bacterium]|nr:ribokinase [Oscillospiraceae bacterium]
MKYLVFGSLNIDRTYTVPHFITAGETMSAAKMELFCGGKGFNQAVALTRAGREVYFAGAVGTDGGMLLEALAADGIHDEYIKRTEGVSGHAVIQVDPNGQNCIIILPGANGEITEADVDSVLADFGRGDLIVLQNEISCVAYILRRAAEKGMIVALNPSPCDARIAEYDMRYVNYLLVNEVEGAAIAGCTDPNAIADMLHKTYPDLNLVLTLGSKGAIYCGADGRRYAVGIYRNNVVDTTAAGDTFTGYFLSQITQSGDAELALKQASVASGISVSRKGASPSIPRYAEVQATDESVLSPFNG